MAEGGGTYESGPSTSTGVNTSLNQGLCQCGNLARFHCISNNNSLCGHCITEEYLEERKCPGDVESNDNEIAFDKLIRDARGREKKQLTVIEQKTEEMIEHLKDQRDKLQQEIRKRYETLIATLEWKKRECVHREENVDTPVSGTTGELTTNDFDPSEYIDVTNIVVKPFDAGSHLNVNFKQGFVHVKRVTYKHSRFIQDMIVFKDQIWCAAIDCILVFDQDCKQKKTIKHDRLRGIQGLTVTESNKVVAACHTNGGLKQLDENGQYVTTLSEGSFNNACCYKQKLYALKKVENGSMVYIYKEASAGKNWIKLYEIPLNYSNSEYDDRMSILNDTIYLSSWCNHCVYSFQMNGNMLHTLGESGSADVGHLKSPVIGNTSYCDGVLLVADCGNNRIQQLDWPWHEWNTIITSENGNLKNPVCVLANRQENSLWVATADKEIFKYQDVNKFIASQINS